MNEKRNGYQMSLRRQANKQMSRPQFLETLQQLFLELETRLHADTLNRLLEKFDSSELDTAHIDLIQMWANDRIAWRHGRFTSEGGRYPQSVV